VHHTIKPRIRPLLPGVSTHLAPLLEVGVGVISMIEALLQFFIAGAGCQAAKPCKHKGGEDGFHDAGKQSVPIERGPAAVHIQGF
jgi:hypothetical protein